jgi:hypothetical protein
MREVYSLHPITIALLQMLAIYDENSPSSKNSNVIVTDPYKYKEAEASSSKLFIPVEQYKERRKKTHFVEVKNLDKRPCKLDFCVQFKFIIEKF